MYWTLVKIGLIRKRLRTFLTIMSMFIAFWLYGTLNTFAAVFGEGGFDPDVETGELAAILFELSGGNMPDIFWDGILPTSQIIFGQPNEERLVLTNNGDATFLTINQLSSLEQAEAWEDVMLLI